MRASEGHLILLKVVVHGLWCVVCGLKEPICGFWFWSEWCKAEVEMIWGVQEVQDQDVLVLHFNLKL